MPSSTILAGPCYGLPSPTIENCKKTLLFSSSSKSSHPQLQCPYDALHFYIHSNRQLRSKFSNQHNPLGGPRASSIVNRVASPFCTIISTSSTFRRWDDDLFNIHVWRALRDNNPPGSLQESEDDAQLRAEEDGDDSPLASSSARSLVGNYAASTALAVKESLPPEGVIVLLACLVGLLTGGSVVLFNIGVT